MWLTNPRNDYRTWSDQMIRGHAVASRDYPRGVTAILWLDEPSQKQSMRRDS